MSRGAMAVFVPFASGLWSGVEELSLSASTIHQHWRIHREAKATEMKESFSPTVPLTVHWDRKLMPSPTNGEVVDRLRILLSGEAVRKPFAAPVTDGKVEPIATAIMKVIN